MVPPDCAPGRCSCRSTCDQCLVAPAEPRSGQRMRDSRRPVDRPGCCARSRIGGMSNLAQTQQSSRQARMASTCRRRFRHGHSAASLRRCGPPLRSIASSSGMSTQCRLAKRWSMPCATAHARGLSVSPMASTGCQRDAARAHCNELQGYLLHARPAKDCAMFRAGREPNDWVVRIAAPSGERVRQDARRCSRLPDAFESLTALPPKNCELANSAQACHENRGWRLAAASGSQLGAKPANSTARLPSRSPARPQQRHP